MQCRPRRPADRRPPVGERRLQATAEPPLDPLDELEQAERVGRAAADVERLAADRIDPLQRARSSVDQVADPEHVANLLAVAVDRQRLTGQGCDAEPGDPALVLDAELPCAIDARLAK